MIKTLADMTAEERDDCEGMWCEFVDFDDSDGYEHSTGSSHPKLGVIAGREGDGEHQVIHLKHGLFCIPDYDITPRPDLPRAWTPDGEPVGTMVDAEVEPLLVNDHKEPEYNTATVNEPGHYFQILKRPTDELPQRAIVSQPCSQKVFYSAMDAGMRGFVGEDLIEAAFYLKWLNGDVPERLEYGAPEYVELMEIINE